MGHVCSCHFGGAVTKPPIGLGCEGYCYRYRGERVVRAWVAVSFLAGGVGIGSGEGKPRGLKPAKATKRNVSDEISIASFGGNPLG